MGALFLGVITTIVVGVNDPTLIEDFEDLKLNSIGFWFISIGAICVQVNILFLGVTYIIIISLSPVAPENMYALLKAPSMQPLPTVA
jgi:hypothetical protein